MPLNRSLSPNIATGAAAYRVPRELLARYAKPGPRYTSYPTAPLWSQDFGPAEADAVWRANNPAGSTRPLALYFHLPFCSSLCWYCGCNVRISRNKRVTVPYLKALDQELAQRAGVIAPSREVSQMHWGGGTPTYLSPEQIEELVGMIKRRFRFAADAELSIEIDPRVTSFEHLQALRRCGFNRLSMGVQDFDSKVQQAVHRIQSFEATAALIAEARRLGFASINIDLMYGLPHQTTASFASTLDLVRELDPERLALFHYAHLPHLKPAQKLIHDADLPDSDTKLAIFELAIETLLGRGYRYIGMDHFAKPDDELALARAAGSLRRNFMGYTTQAGTDLYGFGVTSISEIDGHFVQNQADVIAYEEGMGRGDSPVHRGLLLSREDHLRKAVIEQLICNGRLDFSEISARFGIDFCSHFALELADSEPLAADGLIARDAQGITVLPRGQMLIRNVCMVWDAYLRSPAQPQFSATL